MSTAAEDTSVAPTVGQHSNPPRRPDLRLNAYGGHTVGLSGSAFSFPDHSRRARPRSSRRTMVLGTLLVLVALVGVAFLQDFGPLRHNPRTRVVVFGDSLIAQSSWPISRSLINAGYDPAVSGLNGAAIADFDPYVRSYTGYQGAAVMVIALGTNNAFYASPNAPRTIDLAASVDDLRKVAGNAIEQVPGSAFPQSVRCLVWVNLNDRATALELDQHAPTINQAIRDEAEIRNRAGRQMLVADWNSRSQGHPEWFVSDGVHLNEDGQDAYGRLIRETVQRCRL